MALRGTLLLPGGAPPALHPAARSHAGPSPAAVAPMLFLSRHLLPAMAPLVLSLTMAMAMATPALPTLALPLPPTTRPTPYALSQTLQLGLDNGTIRPCPSTNPSCVSTNPQSPSSAFPWAIPENASGRAVQILRNAILRTQRNVEIKVDQETPFGHYLQVDVGGTGFSRDVIEFLVKLDVVGYRAMAVKVTYVYPFTRAIGDSKGQQERLKRIQEEVGWYTPDIESLDY